MTTKRAKLMAWRWWCSEVANCHTGQAARLACGCPPCGTQTWVAVWPCGTSAAPCGASWWRCGASCIPPQSHGPQLLVASHFWTRKLPRYGWFLTMSLALRYNTTDIHWTLFDPVIIINTIFLWIKKCKLRNGHIKL